VPTANVTTANVTVASNVNFSGNVKQAASANVVSVGSAIVQTGVRTDRAGVHTELTDRAHDAEVSAYFPDSDSPPPPTAFYYEPSPPRATSLFASVHRADSRQSWISHRSVARQQRSAIRQFETSVHFRASGRQSAHSFATDPVIDLMNKVFDKVTGDAAAQRADVDRELARRDAELARCDAEFERGEKNAIDKARLQLEDKLPRKEIAAAEKRQTDMQFFCSAA